jgi:tRNA/tmRNA/rRNA uracil-C5-methylase (TrmA/RlmC/RlmD family)
VVRFWERALKPGDIIPLTLKACRRRADDRAPDGQVVLVAGAIPGERVQARLERVAKGVAYAQTLTVESRRRIAASVRRSAVRWLPLQPHRLPPAARDQRRSDRRRVQAHRPRRRLPVRWPSPSLPRTGIGCARGCTCAAHRLGFFRENSHDVCDAAATRQLLPATSDALERLMAAMRSLGLDAVREIELSENIDASERVVFLDAAAALDASTLERLAGTDGLTGLGRPSARSAARM